MGGREGGGSACCLHSGPSRPGPRAPPSWFSWACCVRQGSASQPATLAPPPEHLSAPRATLSHRTAVTLGKSLLRTLLLTPCEAEVVSVCISQGCCDNSLPGPSLHSSVFVKPLQSDLAGLGRGPSRYFDQLLASTLSSVWFRA